MQRNKLPEEPSVLKRGLSSPVPAIDLDGSEHARLTPASLARLQSELETVDQVSRAHGHHQPLTAGPRLSGVSFGDRRSSLETPVSIDMLSLPTPSFRQGVVGPETGGLRQALDLPVNVGQSAGAGNTSAPRPPLSFPSKNSPWHGR